MSRRQWLDEAEANRRMHLLRQEEADRSYRRAHGYTENREDEARWRHLKQSTEPGWISTRSPSPPPVRTPRRAAPPPVRIPPPRAAPAPRSQPAPYRPPPREVIRMRPVQRSAQQETRECTICVEDKTLDNFPVVTANCTHQLTACSACVRTWIAGTLNGINWSRISCLSPECTQILQYEDMRRVAAREIFQQYEKFSAREAIGALPHFRYCLNPNCESGQEHTPGTDAMFVCNSCGYTACVACNRAWHAGKTCAEADPRRRQVEDTLSLARIKQTALRCPNAECNVPIEKNEGCAHMTCRKCRTDFCWGCLALWKGENGWHTIHEEGCDPNRLNGGQ